MSEVSADLELRERILRRLDGSTGMIGWRFRAVCKMKDSDRRCRGDSSRTIGRRSRVVCEMKAGDRRRRRDSDKNGDPSDVRPAHQWNIWTGWGW